MNKMKRISSLLLSLMLGLSFFLGIFIQTTQERIQPTSSTVVAVGDSNTNLYAYLKTKQFDELEKKWYIEVGFAFDYNNDQSISEEEYSQTLTEISNNLVFSSAKVYVRTRDMTAIAQLGDYQAKDECYTITPLQLTTTTTINVQESGLQIDDNLREFVFEIYRVEITDSKKGKLIKPSSAPTISSVTLNILSEFQINSVEMHTVDYLQNTCRLDYIDSMIEQRESISFKQLTNNIHYTSLGNKANNWWNAMKYMSRVDMLKLGLEVDGSAQQDEWHDAVSTHDGFIVVKMAAGIGTENPFAEWYIKFESDDEEDLGIDNAYTGTFNGVSVRTKLSSGILYDKYIDEEICEVDNDNTIIVDDIDAIFNAQSGISTSFSQYTFDDVYHIFNHPFNLRYIPINYRAKMLQATIGSLYTDAEGNTKLGLSVRFNEPLQFPKYSDKTANKPYITTNIGMGRQKEFYYVCGEGTDTFYFEADMTDIKSNITNIELTDSEYFINAYDYDPKASMNLLVSGRIPNGWDEMQRSFDCSFDLREPEVIINENISNRAQKAHNVMVETWGVSQTGKLYYAWIDDPNDVPKNLTETAILEQEFQSIPSPTGISGTRWLYVKAVSELGKESDPSCTGPYYFDNEPPKIDVKEVEHTYKNKSFELTVSNNLSNLEKKADMQSFYAILSNGVKEERIPIEIGSNASMDTFTLNYSITATEIASIMENELGYGNFQMKFEATDELENKFTSESRQYYYDTRNVFTVTYDTDAPLGIQLESGEFVSDVLNEYYYTVDLSKTDKIRFTSTNASIQIAVKEFVNVKNGETASNDYYTETQNGAQTEITFLEEFPTGLYRFSFYDKMEGSDQIALSRYVYITNGVDNWEDTEIYQKAFGGTILTNKVYQLSQEIPYYYQTDLGAIEKENYGNTKNPASFSSRGEAFKYVYYYELLDLHAVTLTQDIADNLNIGGSSKYKKAVASETAEVGQVWIRYKEQNWRPDSTTESWVYYYYSDGNEIVNVNALSGILQSALNAVSNTIVNYGKEVDLVTEEYLDAHGSPTLAKEQIHLVTESATISKNGTQFKDPVEYAGDQGLYLFLDAQAPLASNVVVYESEYSYVYYKTAEIGYRPLTNANGKTLAECFESSGKYQILELDENGIREYYVYIDVDAPILNVSWVSQSGTTENKSFTARDDGEIVSGSNFFISGIKVGEYDTQSFVAIYKYTGQGEGDLLSVHRMSDFAGGNGVMLADGKYHIYVSDRSGNRYSFVFQVNSEELICSVKEVKNSHIQIEMNREESEVRYQVYLDGALLTTNYNERKFTESGYYQILIEDIYGNVYDEYYHSYEYVKDEDGEYVLDDNGNKVPVLDESGNKIPLKDENGFIVPAYFHFKRELPVVSWKYKVGENYLSYDEETSLEMRIVQTGERDYQLSTSTYLQFLPMEGCSYKIISGDPKPSDRLSGWVSLNELTSFTLRIYYERHEESYVTYTCIVDSSAPNISVSYQEGSYALSEHGELEQLIAENKFSEGSNSFTPSFIGFKTEEERTVYVNNGSIVHSKYFKLKISDESGISSVEIYLNGELLFTEYYNFNNLILSRYGEYQIKAFDNFGNVSLFSFTNDRYSHIEYLVDGETMDPEDSPLEWFDYVNKQYTKVEYGNTQVELLLPSVAEVSYMFTAEDGEQYYAAFLLEDGVVYPLRYVIEVKDGAINGINQAQGEAILSLHSSNIVHGKLYGIVKVESIGIELFASIDSAKNVTFVVKSSDNAQKTYTVDSRIITDENVMPYYVKTEISNVASSIQLVDAQGQEIVSSSTNIKLNEAFSISEALDSHIQSVKISYSETGKFESYETIYDGTYYDLLFDNEGIYHVLVENDYGLTTEYYITISSTFIVTAELQYADETKVEYSSAYTMSALNDKFYSNKSVEFFVYATNVFVSVNEEEWQATANAQGYVEVYIETVGTNVVTVRDEYGNSFEKTVVISLQAVSDSEELLQGFNEQALKRDENYTNQKISINADVLTQNGIYYAGFLYGEEMVALYDMLSEEKIELNANNLKDSIGSMGDGEYKIIFRDHYGNKMEKTVNYCGTSTLTITRTTINSLQAEIYPIEKMLEKQEVWTNNSVSFVVSANEYVLRVDDMENVLSIGFDTKTKNEYQVTYLDEYGFQYAFTVHLFRQEITINAAEDVQVSIIDDVFVTNNDVCVQFTENAVCTYVFNGMEERPYEVGERLYKDGIYRFKAVDVAGNTSTYTIEKDSVVEYRLEGTGAGEVLLNGSVTNGASVQFYAENSDSAYLKKVFHNNQLIEFDDVKFIERGKWELIVADEVGNESYFRFYILYGKMDGFSYRTPYDYVISSVKWELNGTSVMATETIKESGKLLETTENGFYMVEMRSLVTGDIQNFTFTIDQTPPQVQLEGCKEGEKTINDVTISGYEIGDTIYVYKDEVLIKTVAVDSNYADIPVISEGGKYVVIIENEAGISTELSFERTYVPNVAGSMLIIILCLAVVIGLLVGLIWRNHSKTDN